MAVASAAGVAIGGLEPPFNPASASRIARTLAARMSCRVDDDPDADAFELGVAGHEVLARR
jgi:hypothetical protein